MEAGHIAAGGMGDVGHTTVGARDAGHVARRRLTLVVGAVIVAFGGAFAVGSATSTTRIAPARLAPAVNSAGPAALKIAVKPSVSVPTLVPAPKPKAKPKAKPKPVTVAAAPVVAAPVVTAPVRTPVTPVVVTPTTPSVTSPPPPVQTHQVNTPPPPVAKKPTNSGTGTVSGSG